MEGPKWIFRFLIWIIYTTLITLNPLDWGKKGFGCKGYVMVLGQRAKMNGTLSFSIYISFFIFNIDYIYIYTHTHIGKSYSIKRREEEEKKKNVISMWSNSLYVPLFHPHSKTSLPFFFFPFLIFDHIWIINAHVCSCFVLKKKKKKTIARPPLILQA